MPKVINKHNDVIPPNAVYIGRPSKWGNPFAIGKDASREVVIEKYREWLFERPELIEAAKRELAGKDLVCFCAPKKCHGDVLLEVSNDGLDVETRLLREVYEAARQLLRFNGVDKHMTIQAADRLDDAIEQVKLLDGGNYDT